MDSVIEIIRSIRNARAERKVEASKWIEAQVLCRLSLTQLSIPILQQSKPGEGSSTVLKDRHQRQATEEKALVIVLKESEVVLPFSG